MTVMTRPNLLEDARHGDEAAFSELMRQHRSMLWSVSLRVTKNHHDAEDALQNTFVAAWRGLSTFRGDAAVGTWLYRIAANAALAVARSRDRVRLPGEFDVTIADRTAATDAEIIVRDALAGLPAVFREALVLRELCDLTYEQIAAQQGVGVQTVKSRLNRARAKLLVELQEQGLSRS